MYLTQLTIESKDLLEKIGKLVTQFRLGIRVLQNDVNCGERLEVDYKYYEKLFHEAKYLR